MNPFNYLYEGWKDLGKSAQLFVLAICGVIVCLFFADNYANHFKPKLTDIEEHDHYTVTWPNKNSDTYCVKSFGEHSNGPYRLHLMGGAVVIVANGRIYKVFKDTCPLEDY